MKRLLIKYGELRDVSFEDFYEDGGLKACTLNSLHTILHHAQVLQQGCAECSKCNACG